MIFESLRGMNSSILGNMLKNIYFLSLITFHKEASVKCFGLFFFLWNFKCYCLVSFTAYDLSYSHL